jgi:organic radical activating enzyme
VVPLNEELEETKARLASVSSCFCLAKWLQSTIHLHSGTTHSCHHPQPHTIPTDLLRENPSTLHNTPIKKDLRRDMIKGIRPEECAYCWNIEDTSPNLISDRLLKSNECWAKPHFETIKSLDPQISIDPTYLEVSFSNVCNMKCCYCIPSISSSWENEIRKFGPYPFIGDFGFDSIQQNKKENETNPFLKAFWNWWPRLSERLEIFRITGGEPLLSPDTEKILDFLIENPRPQLDFAINTNLSLPESTVKRFCEKFNTLYKKKAVQSLTIFTSLDAWDKRAEYIRFGLDFSLFQKNVSYVLNSNPDVRLICMSTFNALSVTSYKNLLDYFHHLKNTFSSRHETQRVILDIPYLMRPAYLSVKILTAEHQKQVGDIIQYMENLRGPEGYLDNEIDKLKRVHQWMTQPTDESLLIKNRQNFYRFIREHDRRRGTHFLQTFPEMEHFWNLCRPKRFDRSHFSKAQLYQWRLQLQEFFRF